MSAILITAKLPAFLVHIRSQMTQQNTLDLKGNFQKHPFAELLVEISRAKLSGSMRLSRQSQKTVVYFDKGEVIHGVANSKALRLFNVMLQQKRIDKQTVAKYPNFANDLEFSISLMDSGEFSKEDVDAAVAAQIESIVVDALTWPEGEWHFSPLARLRGDLRYKTDIYGVLIQYARCLPADTIQHRFRSVKEAFSVVHERIPLVNLQAHEMYLLARFGDVPLMIEDLRQMSSLPESGMLQALYVLWLGGILVRRDWNAAFTPTKIGEILTARISRVKEASRVDRKKDKEVFEETAPESLPYVPVKAPDLVITLEEYLQQVESAETHYDILGIDDDADLAAIKTAYFGMAKLFHPDRYHRETGTRLRRIQVAFTELSHAHETLKNPESRESYNFKMRKEMDAREKRRAAGQPDQPDIRDAGAEQALECFEQALQYMNDDEYGQASVLLARAVHYSPDNAQFRAYYGKALSADDKQRHKAESELQTAVRLDPKNAKIRLMLVELFVEMNMAKRAVGELTRFLEIVPNNRDAQKMLARLQPQP